MVFENTSSVFVEKDPPAKYLHGNSKNLEILKLLLHTCNGVKQLHMKGIIHQNIKCTELVTSNTNNIPKLSDLSSAKCISNNIHNLPSKETDYTAPEVS